MSDSVGQKKSIAISLFIWIFTMFFAYLISDQESLVVQYLSKIFNDDPRGTQRTSFYIIGLLVGGVMGGTQSTSRSLMSKLTPPDKKTEFFGFYSLFGKSSAVLGPLTFGLISFATGSQAYAILSICFFFIIGLIILKFVKDPSN